ncbi:hypothetical protein ACJMK2_021712 [Sinanodonta woodiana]|uniref:Uncharacterized protein n=1 Tax=Sinanodonta woodiana TaxID=1069815 RepID=A0ABD3TGV5_SINWO
MCQLCNAVISCGGRSVKPFTTAPLNKYLLYKHPDEYNNRPVEASASVGLTSGIQQTET